LYCDDPKTLAATLTRLVEERDAFATRRAEAVERLTCLPLGGVVDRMCDALRQVVPPGAIGSPAC
jgi:hypothetical protein